MKLKALHRHFLSKPHNISLRYCQTGDKFHSLIMWNTLVNIDVPFRKLLQSVFCSSHDVSQGVNQWCNVKLLALPHGSWEDRCVWQHIVAQEERRVGQKRQADYFATCPPLFFVAPHRGASFSSILFFLFSIKKINQIIKFNL